MKKFIITLLTTSFLTVGLYGQVTSETQRQRPQRVQLQKLNKLSVRLCQKIKESKKFERKQLRI